MFVGRCFSQQITEVYLEEGVVCVVMVEPGHIVEGLGKAKKQSGEKLAVTEKMRI